MKTRRDRDGRSGEVRKDREAPQMAISDSQVSKPSLYQMYPELNLGEEVFLRDEEPSYELPLLDAGVQRTERHAGDSGRRVAIRAGAPAFPPASSDRAYRA